jgi:hypothetical protein
MMGVAERMLAVVEGEVRLPMVMHRSAFKLRQDGDSSHALLTAFGMDSLVSQEISAGDVQPVQLALNSQTALIKTDHMRCYELLLDGGETEFRLIDHGCISIQHKGFRWPMSIKVSQQLASTDQRAELVVVQVAGLGFEAWPLLHGLRHLRGKVCLHLFPTRGTALDCGAVFGDFDPHRWNIKHLPFLVSTRLDGRQFCGAMRADRGFVYVRMVRLLDHLEGMSLVTFLTTATTAALLAQTARARLFQAIATRRFATVPAILGQLVTQDLHSLRLLSHSSLQLPHLLLQGQDDGYECFFIQFRKLVAIKIKW